MDHAPYFGTGPASRSWANAPSPSTAAAVGAASVTLIAPLRGFKILWFPQTFPRRLAWAK